VARAVLVAVAVLAGLYVLYQLRSVLVLLFMAGFLAIALAPGVTFFERRLRIRRRPLAILSVYVCLLLGGFAIALAVVPPIVDEVDKFVQDVPGYVDDIRQSETLREYDEKYGIVEELQNQADKLPSRLDDAVGALQSVTVGVFSALFQLVTVLVMTFFLLNDGPRALGWAMRQLGPRRAQRARAIAGDVSRAVGGYVAGAATISLIAGTTTFIMLTILDMPFKVPLAVLMSFFVLIPLVGSAIAGAIIAIVAGLHDFPTALIVWTIFFVLYQQLENNAIQPFIYRRTVALHPLLVIVAVLVGGSQLGILGALVAIPVAATIQILVRDWWFFRQNPDALDTPRPGGKPPDGEPPPAPSGPPEPEPAVA
jgi:predicted PurR-regulated permease PerM